MWAMTFIIYVPPKPVIAGFFCHKKIDIIVHNEGCRLVTEGK